MAGIRTISDIPEVREQLAILRASSSTIALVPTLGALHEGHLSLIRIAAQEADLVVVSLFLNPTQFGEAKDLENYPSTFTDDCKLAESAGAELIFCPESRVMYKDGHSVWVDEELLTATLCGPTRPGHFKGVLTVVAKLFNIIEPDIAVFGEKDAQQLALIQRLVRDLNFDIQILSGETVREKDGLALSSRNANLNTLERARAASISQALFKTRDRYHQGVTNVSSLQDIMTAELQLQADDSIDYISIVDPESFQAVEDVSRESLLAVAVRIGRTRLIDNVRLVPQ